MGARVMRLLVAGANVDLHMLVPDSANDVAAKFIAAEFAAGRMAVENSDLAAGPRQRCFFRGERLGGRIIFSILRIYHRTHNYILLVSWGGGVRRHHFKMGDPRGTHSSQSGRAGDSSI